MSYVIQRCSAHGCQTPIRVRSDQTLAYPVCKWCDKKVSHAANPKTWPDGMPNPELPWPWMTDADRERKLRLPFWKERLRNAKGNIYKEWLRP